MTEEPESTLGPGIGPYWFRNFSFGTKGVKIQVVGIDPTVLNDTDANPFGVVESYDSHGKLDELKTGCPPVKLSVVCSFRCAKESCNPTSVMGIIQLPPGTVILPEEIVETQDCC